MERQIEFKFKSINDSDEIMSFINDNSLSDIFKDAILLEERLISVEDSLQNAIYDTEETIRKLEKMDRQYNNRLRTIVTTSVVATPLGYLYGLGVGASSVVCTYGFNSVYNVIKERKHGYINI
jgi:hypothetical protein